MRSKNSISSLMAPKMIGSILSSGLLVAKTNDLVAMLASIRQGQRSRFRASYYGHVPATILGLDTLAHAKLDGSRIPLPMPDLCPCELLTLGKCCRRYTSSNMPAGRTEKFPTRSNQHARTAETGAWRTRHRLTVQARSYHSCSRTSQVCESRRKSDDA